MLQIAMYLLSFSIHCLLTKHNQSTAICGQIIREDIEVEYFCDNIIYYYPTSVNVFLQIYYGIGVEVWKIVFHSILEIFHSIPFWHLPYSIPKFPFHFIPYHALLGALLLDPRTQPSPHCRFLVMHLILDVCCSYFRVLKS